MPTSSQGKTRAMTETTNTTKVVNFNPVKVERGRKFRGFAYDVCADIVERNFQLYGWHGSAGCRTTYSIKLWDPARLKPTDKVDMAEFNAALDMLEC